MELVGQNSAGRSAALCSPVSGVLGCWTLLVLELFIAAPSNHWLGRCYLDDQLLLRGL